MTTYYKATRTDGTSFHDAKTTWTVGETVKINRLDRRKTMCGTGILHASDAPGESLVGGSWPCRLFEVEGEPVAQEGHKFGFHELTVVRELPAWQALGPNGEAVAAPIEQVRSLTSEHAQRLASAWRAAWRAAWDAARYAAWDAARDAAWGAARNAAWYAAAGMAGDAAAALVVRDLISDEQFQVLYGPWASAMEAME